MKDKDHLGFLKNYQESILYTLILVSICGLIITYVNPKKIVVPYLNLVLNLFDLNYLKS